MDRAPQPGDILLFHRAAGLNRFITWFTRSPYYHVAIYAGNNCVIEARPKGVVRRDLRTREGGHHFVVIADPTGKGREALNWAETKVGEGYDRADVAVIILERVFQHLHINHTPRDKFACGEFVAMAFQEVGAPLFTGRAPADIVPGDFASLLN